MGWIRVSDDFYDNDKMFAAGSIGRDLYWHGMAFCNRNLTNGLIPKRRALTLVDFSDAAVMVGMGGVDGQDCAPIAVERLLDAGLWHEDDHDCPSCVQPGPRHYIVHDYLKYQPSREEVESKRDEAKERMRIAREARSKDVRANTSGTSAEVRVTPTPTPTPSSSCGDLSGGVALVDAREPRPHCSKHPNENSEDNCRPCKKRREWDEKYAQADELDSKRQQREAIRTAREACSLCDENGMRPVQGGLKRCDHQAVAQ